MLRNFANRIALLLASRCQRYRPPASLTRQPRWCQPEHTRCEPGHRWRAGLRPPVTVRRPSAATMPVPLRRLAWLVPICALLGPPGPAGAVTPAQQCAARKLKAAGREIGAEMSCYAKAKKAGGGVDGNCLSRQRMQADTRIEKADGGCSGTAADIDAAVDACVAAFLNDDPGNSACPAASAETIGKGAKAELGCRAKEVLRPNVFAACDAKEDVKTSASLGKAGGCVNPTAVLADSDTCNTVIDAIIEPTTTTTTTIPPACSSSANFFCAPQSPVGPCFSDTHRGPGNVCVDTDSCSASCNTDSDCSPGKVCIGSPSGDGLGGCGTACCSPCPSYSCLTSQAPACGGTCPSGQVCGQASGANSCECVTPDDTCEMPSCPFVTQWGRPGSGDGQFLAPIDVAVDGSGNVYVADFQNNRIEKFTNTGTFLTTWGSAGSGDGQFNGPGGVAVDGTGSVFVADTLNNRIQKFDSNGTFLLTFGWGVADGMAAFETCTSLVPGWDRGQRERAVQYWPRWHRGGWERECLRRGPFKPAHPEVHEYRDIPHDVGQPRQQQRAVPIPRRGRGGWKWKCFRCRQRQRPHPEVRQQRHLLGNVGQPGQR